MGDCDVQVTTSNIQNDENRQWASHCDYIKSMADIVWIISALWIKCRLSIYRLSQLQGNIGQQRSNIRSVWAYCITELYWLNILADRIFTFQFFPTYNLKSVQCTVCSLQDMRLQNMHSQ
jgi:hypothetical protein